MDGNIAHQRNPVIGWDITASAKADAGESISAVQVFVNGITVHREAFDQPTKQWQTTLTQQGQYPGDNKSQLKVIDDSGNETNYYDEWN